MKTYLEYEGVKYPFEGHDIVKTEYGVFLDFLSDRAARTHTFFEEDFLTHLKGLYPKGSVVLDIGANIGNHSLFFSAVCGWMVKSFEPITVSFALLQKNAPRTQCHNVGLGSEPSKAKMAVGMMMNHEKQFSAANMGGVQLEVGEGDIEVQTLDSYGYAPSMIKIDVEGMEAEVLKGSVATLKIHRPDIWLEANKVEQLKECMDILSPIGYILSEIFLTDNPMVRFTCL